LVSFTPRERAPATYWIGGCVGPRAGLGGERKNIIPAGNNNNNNNNMSTIIIMIVIIINKNFKEHVRFEVTMGNKRNAVFSSDQL
jgi:hypothetical protein